MRHYPATPGPFLFYPPPRESSPMSSLLKWSLSKVPATSDGHSARATRAHSPSCTPASGCLCPCPVSQVATARLQGPGLLAQAGRGLFLFFLETAPSALLLMSTCYFWLSPPSAGQMSMTHPLSSSQSPTQTVQNHSLSTQQPKGCPPSCPPRGKLCPVSPAMRLWDYPPPRRCFSGPVPDMISTQSPTPKPAKAPMALQ